MKKMLPFMLAAGILSSNIIFAQEKTNESTNKQVKPSEQKKIEKTFIGTKQTGINKTNIDGKGTDNIKKDNIIKSKKNSVLIGGWDSYKNKDNRVKGNKPSVYGPGGWNVKQKGQSGVNKVSPDVIDPAKQNKEGVFGPGEWGVKQNERLNQQGVNKVSPDVIDPAKQNVKVNPLSNGPKMKTGKSAKDIKSNKTKK